MIFLGCLFNREKEEYYLQQSKTGLSNAANTFQWNLIEGLNTKLSEELNIINVLPVGIFPLQYKKLILKDIKWQFKGSNCSEIGCINVPIIKQYQRYKRCLKLLKKSDDKNIIIYSAYLPFLKAAYRLNKEYKVTVIITDLPEFYDLGKTSFVKKFLRKLNNKKVYKCLERVDKFVLLTEQMKEPLKVGKREYTVIEGICNGTAPELLEDSGKEKIILYTGTLHKKFGIGNLLEAFSSIDSEKYRLWICGGGDMEEEIVSRAAKDSRIKFYGYLSKSDIGKLQQQSTVLVNPRQNEGEYTKYSFPSKTMEYMLSGKPVIMYKLDGIPNEYDEYLHLVSENTVDALKNKILEVCEQPYEQREAFGCKASEFVMKEKNSLIQAEKVIDISMR